MGAETIGGLIHPGPWTGVDCFALGDTHATTGRDETLRLTQPVRVDLDTTRLLARRPG